MLQLVYLSVLLLLVLVIFDVANHDSWHRRPYLTPGKVIVILRDVMQGHSQVYGVHFCVKNLFPAVVIYLTWQGQSSKVGLQFPE